MRLDKFLSSANLGTRKEVTKLIKSRIVKVNAHVITDSGFIINENTDHVYVNDTKIEYIKNIYLMLNKPVGVVSATIDNYQKTVIDLVSEYRYLDIFPVGRLDINTTGLLLLTNDGALSHNMLSPTHHVDKTYEVLLKNDLSNDDLLKLENGIIIDDKLTKPALVDKISDKLYHITIHEGMFHQVKRMFLAVENEVVTLKRISFGPLKLDENLKEGSYRLLTDDEMNLLKPYLKHE